MPDPVREVKQAIGDLGMATPIVKVGTTLAKGGEMIQRGYEAVKRAVTPAPKRPKKDIVLPRSGVRRLSGRRR